MSTAPTVHERLALSDEQLWRYEEDGFLIFRGLFAPEEVAELAAEAERLALRHDLISRQNLRCRFMPHVESGEPVFEVFDPVNDVAPVCRRVSLDRRILDVLADIYGEEPCLFKDKLIFKPPGAKGYDLHQDLPACWEGFPATFTTVLLAIDSMSPENGCTEVFPGYHRRGLIDTGPDCKFRLPDSAVDESRRVPLDLEPGDVAVFGCYVPHRSAPNRSDRPRRALYVSYNALSDGGRQRERHYAEFREYLLKYYRTSGRTRRSITFDEQSATR